MKSIQFCLKVQVEIGKAVYLVHSQNNWQLNQSSRMQWISVQDWTLSLDIHQPRIEYKYVISDFELTNDSTFSWEKGPNRILKVDKIRRFVRNDQWGKRRIVIAYPRETDHTVMILIGENFVKRMKHSKEKGQQYFYSKLDIEVEKDNQNLNFQYYLLHYEQTPQEFVSRSIFVPLPQDCIYRSEEVSFYSI